MSSNVAMTREEEEKHLSETLAVAQKNLDHILEEIKTLTEDTETFMFEANKSKDEAILTLWNNVRAQLNESKGWLVRMEKARKKPYFGRIDFQDLSDRKEESYYIGRVGISKSPAEPVVIDWRAPMASLYYDNGLGKGSYAVDADQAVEIDLQRKRTYEVENDRLVDFYDMDVVSNDELLTKYLSKNKSEVLGEIIATIQQEQNRIIRRSPKTNVIVQGVAGSGKTTVAMHRISYILFNYARDFRPEDFYIIGSNQILLNYITGVLPELDVYGAKQMTMEQLFIRLLYEDWDKKYTVSTLHKQDESGYIKGSDAWFQDMKAFCQTYEKSEIPCEDIYLEKYHTLLLSGERILRYIDENPQVSMQSKRLMLNEILFSQYENVMSGRYAGFTEEEREELEKTYHTYFAKWGKYGKSDWNGSVFELYQDFLRRQQERGYNVPYRENTFDVYDLAALAYLYKRIKETDPIREASHVVIDEAQDFGMMAYHCLHYCLRNCTYTVMGDTSQNIHDQYGLNDWTELRELLLTGIRDSFLLLRKSYRNTVEISEFATEILRHGDFSIYPVEPIVRHGSDVSIKKCSSTNNLVDQAVKTITAWQQQGYETIAVVCRDEAEVKKVFARLKSRITLKDMDTQDAGFGNGVMVLPITYTKGLEFDAVLIWDPTARNYPYENASVKMLYVAATRALHELTILYIKDLTKLIAEKAPEGKQQEEFHQENDAETIELLKITARESLKQQKEDAGREMKERNYLGPQRITVEAPSVNSSDAPTVMKKQSQSVRRGTAAYVKEGNTSLHRYGSLPEERELQVPGHVKANTAVKWIKKTKSSLAVTSSYGILTITPISDGCFHISFLRGEYTEKESALMRPEIQQGLKWTARESSTTIEVAVKQLQIRIEKRDGALKFMTPDRKLLLSERSQDSRLVEDTGCWEFFEFDRSERVKSKGYGNDEFMDLTNKARYISGGRGKGKMPLILSSKGYTLAIASEQTTMFCKIQKYGQYLYMEGTDQIEYYFMKSGTGLCPTL